MEEKINQIKKLIEDLLEKLTINGRVETEETVDGPQFIIRTPEGGLLIGENGKNLISFNHLVKKIISKEKNKEDSFSFSLDINGYQNKKIEDLKDIARVNAQRVRYFKKEIILKAMSSYERRIVHMALSDSPDISTDSIGQEPERKIVIKPYL